MVETMNNIGNRQPDSNAGCSKQKGVKNKQTRQLVLWIGALIVGAVLGIFGISWLDGLMNFIATVYTRLFQLLAVPTIALAVITTLASLGNQADTGKIFRHAITYTLLTTIAAAAVDWCSTTSFLQAIYLLPWYRAVWQMFPKSWEKPAIMTIFLG